MGTYAGIDPHSSTIYIRVIDADGKRLYGGRLENHLEHVMRALARLTCLQPKNPLRCKGCQ